MAAIKLEKKLKRKLLQVSQRLHSCNLLVSDSPTVYVFVGNGGLECGISKELLVSILNFQLQATDSDSMSAVSMVHDNPNIDSVIVEFKNLALSEQTVNKANGCCVQEQIVCHNLLTLAPKPLMSGPPVHLLMTFLTELPLAFHVNNNSINLEKTSLLPPGCHLIDNFITDKEEMRLIDFFAYNTSKVRESLWRSIKWESTIKDKKKEG